MNPGVQLRPEPHPRDMTRPLCLVAGVIAASVLLYWPALAGLARLVSEDEGYSHITIVPLVSAWFLWKLRADLEQSSDSQSRIAAGIAIVLGVVGYATGWLFYAKTIPGYLSVWMFSLVCVWVGCFLLAYGVRAARQAAFPLAFLLLMIPLPGVVVQSAIGGLQHASAALTYFLFRLLGVPVFRNGFVFALPNLNIEVARECSGIRSSISLMLTTLILAQLSLTSKMNRLLLALSVVPIAVFKNGVRIVTLSLLSMYVDPSFLTGNLHHRGGVVFFLLAMAVVFALMRLLQGFESRPIHPRPHTAQLSTSEH